MSNFRLNLPIDIPWKLVNCSEDMMDKTFCDKKMPTPFRSSISIYTYQPKDEDLPEEYINCGQTITYLKVSCSITGYQHSENIKGQIIDLLSSVDDIDYSKIEQITEEYFGCYGVMLNVSVHPADANKNDLAKYPHIIDFEPKLRDFYQAASETGEVLTTSVGKLSTNKSFGTTDSTESSWSGGADVKIPAAATAAATGVPADIGVNGKTGQTRTESDQANWGITTDASRERREGQSTTTQLSQMYNLLTGYHAGTNRSSFVMLPRPHILQPTDKRTFVQGLRVIEGIQDFFLIVLREKTDPVLRVDVNLQTGHFPENINFETPSLDETFDTDTEVINVTKIYQAENRWNPTFEKERFNDKFNKPIHKINDGWSINTDSNPIITEEVRSQDQGILSIDFVEIVENNLVFDLNYQVEDGAFSRTSAIIDRKYTIQLRKLKVNAVAPVADVSGLLITQRKLCTQITFNDCISAIDLTNPRDIRDLVDIADVFEPPFDLSELFPPKNGIGFEPGINPDIVKGTVGPNPLPTNFSFQKAILRKISSALINFANSPSNQPDNKISFLQTKSFQKQLLQILPKKVLESPANSTDIIKSDIGAKFSKDFSLKQLLTTHELQLTKKMGVSKKDILNIKKSNFNNPNKDDLLKNNKE